MHEGKREPSPIVVVGDALIDEIHDEKGGVEEYVGGAALNVAVGLAILECPTTLVAMVGDDAAGESIREHLGHYGVGLLATPGPYGTSRGVSVRASGEPRYVFNEAAQNRRIEFSPAVLAAIDAAPLVVTSCFPLDDAEQTNSLRQAVRSPRARLIVDANPRESMLHDRAAFCAALDLVAPETLLLKLGDEDSELLYGLPVEAAVPRLQQLGTARVLATAGADGAALWEEPGGGGQNRGRGRSEGHDDGEVRGRGEGNGEGSGDGDGSSDGEGSGHREVETGGLETGGRSCVTRVPIATMPGLVLDTIGAGDATLASVVADIVNRKVPRGEQWQPVLDHAMRVAAATCRHPGALLRLPD